MPPCITDEVAASDPRGQSTAANAAENGKFRLRRGSVPDLLRRFSIGSGSTAGDQQRRHSVSPASLNSSPALTDTLEGVHVVAVREIPTGFDTKAITAPPPDVPSSFSATVLRRCGVESELAALHAGMVELKRGECAPHPHARSTPVAHSRTDAPTRTHIRTRPPRGPACPPIHPWERGRRGSGLPRARSCPGRGSC